MVRRGGEGNRVPAMELGAEPRWGGKAGWERVCGWVCSCNAG